MNAEKDMKDKKEESYENLLLKLSHANLRSEVLRYMVDNDEDPIELLKKFAEPLRVLINCDQVIYRDLEETRIMVNSPQIEKMWAVPIEYCKQCQHFDAHHPMYKDGYTEMENCKEGWNGIPVYEKCPIKSSLTRIIYCDDDVAGYLAIHYVKDFHKFTDLERETIEGFARLISVCLSRYINKKLKRELEKLESERQITHQKNLINYFVESYDSAYSVDLIEKTFEVLHMSHEFSEVFILNGNAEDMEKFISEHIHEEDREMMREIIKEGYVPKRLKKEKSFTFTVREVFGDVTRTMRGLIVKGIDEYHIAVGFMDISEQLKKEKERQQQLSDALSMAESSNRAKTTFLNNMSHDIRTPMNAIIGYTDLATSHIDNKEQVKDYLTKISRASGHLLSLINDVLDMSRIESGKMNLHERPESIESIVSTVDDVLKTEIAHRDLNFKVEMKGVSDKYIMCDRLRLNQVLINILSNAVKYTNNGGTVSFVVKENPVTSSEYREYEFVVEDTGMGMTKDFLKTIFDPFTRVNSTTISGIEGTGLGMPIAKNIIDMMGGSISISSEPDIGTKVSMLFKFKLADADMVEEDIDDNIPCKDVNLEGLKILLVEDNALNLEIATGILEDCGAKVFSATDGSKAFKLIKKSLPGDYDLVLMDIQMPVMDGYEATRRIRELDSEISKIPIIAMTANAFEEDKRKAFSVGMNEHISKPINEAKLKKALAKYKKA